MPVLDITWWVGVAKQLNLVALCSYLIPLGVGLRYWHSIGPAYRPLIWFALLPGCLFGSLAEVGRMVWHNNIAFVHISTWLETLLLCWLYYNVLRSAQLRRLILGAVGLFVVVALTESFYLGLIWVGQSHYTHAVQSAMLIALALLYFEQILRELRSIHLERDPMFLVSVGVTLYYAGTVMLFLLENEMNKHQQTQQIWLMYIIQSVLLILLNSLFSLALYNAARNAKLQWNNSIGPL